MLQVNILEAKTDLSKLIKLIESGKEDSVIIARYGKPVVKMSSYKSVSTITATPQGPYPS